MLQSAVAPTATVGLHRLQEKEGVSLGLFFKVGLAYPSPESLDRNNDIQVAMCRLGNIKMSDFDKFPLMYSTLITRTAITGGLIKDDVCKFRSRLQRLATRLC